MARLHRVERSRKEHECGKCGTKLPPGSAYVHWSPGFRGTKRVRCTAAACSPRPSEMTANDKLSRAYEARESVEDAIRDWDRRDPAPIVEAMENAAETLREVAEEYREAVEAMNETAEGGSVAAECEERADGLESWADEIEQAAEGFPETPDEGEPDCESCDGEGETRSDCGDCEGSGEKECPEECDDGLKGEDPCEACDGVGSVDCGECDGSGEAKDDCPSCNGSGKGDPELTEDAISEWADAVVEAAEGAIGECPV